ncbi:MAG: ABC transporter permease subunit [Gammaproteobacteria bacterium]|nr:ABC transporter permease subunit [Gammaproteobacteria bacterium]
MSTRPEADVLPSQSTIQGAAVAGRSLWQDAFRRFLRNKAAMSGVVVVGILATLSVLVPILSPHGIEDIYWDSILVPPSIGSGFWFGTDVNGRDLLVRCFYAGRISLTIGVLATSVALCIGVIFGAVAGFSGGNTDNFMMRFVDVLYALPTLFFIIILVTVLGASNIFFVFMCIGALQWLTMARIVRGQTLSVKRRDYLMAAHAIGLPTTRILSRYIVPNVTGPVIVYVTLLIPINILIESYLSFLGLGVQEPLTSWGLLISQGAAELESAPWLLIFPATLLTITLFAFNFIGDGLRDAFDPKDR